MGMNDINSLSHTKWNCKYHIVFAERLPPAMRVRRKKLYFWLENKPPDERAETGSPTIYEFVHREVLLV